MNYALIVIATLIACEVAIRLPFNSILLRLATYAKKVRFVLLSGKVSDHWKEIVLPVYAGRICKASLELLAFILAVLSPYAVAGAVSFQGIQNFIYLLARLDVSVAVMAIAIVYVFVRNKMRK